MFKNLSAKEQNIDTTRRFRVIKEYSFDNSNQAIIGDILELVRDDDTSFPYFKNITKNRGLDEFTRMWPNLEYADEIASATGNSIPEYILCSTPELAKKVLEKIERESPNVKWCAGDKPSEFIPYNHYPKMVIRNTKNELGWDRKKYYQSQGVTDFTTAEEYLGYYNKPPQHIINKYLSFNNNLNDYLDCIRPFYFIDETSEIDENVITLLQNRLTKPTKGNKIMNIITNTFKSEENKALEHFNLGTSEKLNDAGRQEYIDFVYQTGNTDKKEFLKKIVEAYNEVK